MGKLNVLLIGNSHMRYNSLATTLQKLGGGLAVTSILENGATLQRHYDNPATRAAIVDGPGDGKPWDWVVLQPNSLEPVLVWPGGSGNSFVNKDNFIEHAVLLANLATNGTSGPAKTLMFEVAPKADAWNDAVLGASPPVSVSWYAFDFFDVGDGAGAMQELIHESFLEARGATELKREDLMWICPVGEVWLRSGVDELDLWSRAEASLNSGLVLFRSDWNHPSPVGSYAMALTLWRWMTGKDTWCLPAITGAQAPLQPDYGAGQGGMVVTTQFARKLQKTVDAMPVSQNGYRVAPPHCLSLRDDPSRRQAASGSRRRQSQPSWAETTATPSAAPSFGTETMAMSVENE